MNLEEIFNNMAKRPVSSKKETKEKEEKPEPLAHDQVVLLTYGLTVAQLDYLMDPEVIVLPPHGERRWVFEPEVPNVYGPGTLAHTDLELWIDGKPRVLFEIKSKSEAQSASHWHRQTRGYWKGSGLPCFLVIAHDLQPYMYDYLRESETPWFDVRAAPGLRI
jgi:hypothetical protein